MRDRHDGSCLVFFMIIVIIPVLLGLVGMLWPMR